MTTRPPELPTAPRRDDDAHKGSFGHLLLVAGSRNMSGAARLSGLAALRGGVGLLTIATPRSAQSIVAMQNPAWMTLPLDEADDGLAGGVAEQIETAWRGKHALALGPGLGQVATTQQAIRQIYATCPLPMVLDADGLNAFAQDPSQLATRAEDAPRILTPHPGELARLLDCDVQQIQQDRAAVAERFAREHRVTLLLKGPATIITDGRRQCVNRTGNSGLARGGTGDVLTGLIGALLAQGMNPLDAGVLGAHLQGAAGDIAAQRYTKEAMLVTELLDCLPEAWRALLDRP